MAVSVHCTYPAKQFRELPALALLYSRRYIAVEVVWFRSEILAMLAILPFDVLKRGRNRALCLQPDCFTAARVAIRKFFAFDID